MKNPTWKMRWKSSGRPKRPEGKSRRTMKIGWRLRGQKAQRQKEREEAKAKADAEEVRKQKEANNLFQEVAKPGTGKGM